MDVDPPPPDFSKFVNMLYSKGLKLSVRVSSFSEEILICQLCVYHFDVAIGIILVVIGHHCFCAKTDKVVFQFASECRSHIKNRLLCGQFVPAY